MTANPSKPGLHGALSRFLSAPAIGAGQTAGGVGVAAAFKLQDLAKAIFAQLVID